MRQGTILKSQSALAIQRDTVLKKTPITALKAAEFCASVV